MYRPLRFFTIIGLIMIGLGLIPGLRFIYFFLTGQGGGNVQSLILAAILLIVGFQVILIGLVADLISRNRQISEEILYRMKLQTLETPKAGEPVPDEPLDPDAEGKHG